MIGTPGLLLVAMLAAGPSPNPGGVEPVPLTVTMRLDGFLSRGQLERDLIAFRASAFAYGDTLGFFVQPEAAYGRFFGRDADRELYVRGLVYLKPRSFVHYYWLAIAETSLRRGHEYRLTTGPGVGFNLVQREKLRLLTSVTLIQDSVRFRPLETPGAPSVDGYYGARRGADADLSVQRLGLRAFGRMAPTKFLELNFDIIYVPAVDLIDDFRVLSSASLVVPVGSAFSLTATADLYYDAVHALPVDRPREDLTVRFGVQVTLPPRSDEDP